MKYLDEYRDGAAAREAGGGDRADGRRGRGRSWRSAAGRRTRIVKYGIDEILPPEVELVHGPGCPVCVTSLEMIDRAHAIAARPEVIFCSFGDMLRVPGSRGDLLAAQGAGGDVRVVYSPLDAVNLAAANPDRKVVFFAIGFETTAPANAMAVWHGPKREADELQRAGLARAGAAGDRRDPRSRRTTACRAFLGPGHVCTVMGYDEYEPIADATIACRSSSPGSSRSTCSRASCWTVRQLEAGRAEVENQYARAVRREGNPASRRLIDDVFEVCDRKWRGHRRDPRERLPAPRRVSRPRRRAALRGRRHRDPGIAGLHQRADPPGAQEAARLPGVRPRRARRRRRWARRWSRPKGPAPRITPTAGISRCWPTS